MRLCFANRSVKRQKAALKRKRVEIFKFCNVTDSNLEIWRLTFLHLRHGTSKISLAKMKTFPMLGSKNAKYEKTSAYCGGEPQPSSLGGSRPSL